VLRAPDGIRPLALAAAALTLSACGAREGISVPTVPSASLQALRAVAQPLRRSDGKIKHIVIIIQENRSFNNLFYGFPGAKTQSYGYDSKNDKIALEPIGLETTWDLAHNSQGFLAACNGTGKTPGTKCRMNGFDKEHVTCGKGGPRCPNKHPQYGYVPHDETKPYFEMAKQYVLADEMFASNYDASSFVSHQYIIAGQASSALNYPTSWWGCEGGKIDKIWTVTQVRGYGPRIRPCFDNKTIGDELDKAGLTWASYATTVDDRRQGGMQSDFKQNSGIWAAYQAIDHIYNGPDWTEDVLSPPQQFLSDVSNGTLRTVSWVTPTWKDSDHAGSGSNAGPSWVVSLVNAVGESQYWSSTVIFVFWDDYGGWYDPAPPKYVDYDGLGLRLPMLIISPYAKKGHVSHVHYEHGSILKFIEDRFRLGRLSQSDRRANSPEGDCFDFSAPPRKFVPFRAPYGRSYFELERMDREPPDDE
jgi:phospholipase C